MFKSKKQEEKLNFETKSYNMNEVYDSSNLVSGYLEYVSSESNDACTPFVVKTHQRYLFEKIMENGVERYREVFTGFIADATSSSFDLPYIIEVKPVMEEVECTEKISKYGMLLLLDEVNSNEKRKIRKC